MVFVPFLNCSLVKYLLGLVISLLSGKEEEVGIDFISLSMKAVSFEQDSLIGESLWEDEGVVNDLQGGP